MAAIGTPSSPDWGHSYLLRVTLHTEENPILGHFLVLGIKAHLPSHPRRPLLMTRGHSQLCFIFNIPRRAQPWLKQPDLIFRLINPFPGCLTLICGRIAEFWLEKSSSPSLGSNTIWPNGHFQTCSGLTGLQNSCHKSKGSISTLPHLGLPNQV